MDGRGGDHTPEVAAATGRGRGHESVGGRARIGHRCLTGSPPILRTRIRGKGDLVATKQGVALVALHCGF